MTEMNDDILDDDESPEEYIDSRGATMPFKSYADALDMVRDLAGSNTVTENDMAFGDPGLGAMQARQTTALQTLDSWREQNGEVLEALPPPQQARAWPSVEDVATLDPSIPADAIRICLEMAETALPDSLDVQGIEAAEEFDEQQQALDITRDLLGLHGKAFEAPPPSITP